MSPRPTAREWLTLAAILGLCVALRLHNVHVPLVDTSDWRQTDTGAVAYFYYHYGIRLLHPQLWHDGPGPDYTQLELQLSPAIAALLAHVFGWSDTLLRVVALALFTGAAVPLWVLVRRRLGPGAAQWTALAYVLLPVGIYFGRVFQPECAQLFFGMCGLWATDRWVERQTRGRYLFALAALSLGVLAKLPNLMLLPVAAALAYDRELWHWRTMLSWRRLLPVAGLVLIPAGAGADYTIVQSMVAASGTQYVNFIVLSLGDKYIAGTANLWQYVWQEVLGMAVTPAGGAAGLLGIWALARRGRRAHWVWVWAAAVLVYGVVVLRAIRFQYYLMPVLPLLAVLMGAGLQYLTAALPRALPKAARLLPPVAAAGLVASLLAGGLFQIQGFWGAYTPWHTGGLALDRALPKGAVVILTGTYNPTLLYYARRHGYRIANLTMSTLQDDVDGGARYVLDQGGIDACMGDYLASHFPSDTIGGIPVYTLHTPLPPLPQETPVDQPPVNWGGCVE